MFWWGITGLVVLRFLMVFLFINNIPFTDMREGGFRPNFSGSYFPDETHYFELAESFSKLSPIANVANIGYPLFLMPIIYFTNAVGPEDIAKIIFIVQPFLFFSLAIILVTLVSFEILKNKKLSLVVASLFTIYPYLLLAILRSADFPRWIPAFHYQMWINIGADYLSAVFLYFGFYLLIKKYNYNKISLFSSAAIGFLFAVAALTRVANILYLPLILLILIWIRKYRESISCGLAAFLAYLPQWVYNFYFFGSPFTYGYRIQELSDHGFETKVIGGWLSINNAYIFFEKIWLNLPMLIWILPILVIIIAVGFWRIFRINKVLAIIIIFWVLLNVGFYIFFVDAQSQLRYFIPSIPPLILLFISGVTKIYEFRRFI